MPPPIDPARPPALGARAGTAAAPDLAKWFAEEVQPHEPELRAYLRRRFPTVQDVDDIVQDSYVQILRRQPAGRIASVRAYLFTIAHHAVLRVFRKRRIFSEVPVSELPSWRLVENAPDAAEIAQTHQQDMLVAEAIAALPGRCREVFKLRVGGGLSHAEIAARLGLSEATVRVQVSRGLQKCTHYLRARGLSEAS